MCWLCQFPLAWIVDRDVETEDGEMMIETHLHCPHCTADYTVIHNSPDKP